MLLSLFALSACTASRQQVSSNTPAEARMPTPPPPFTAAQIRTAMPRGTQLLFAVQSPDGLLHTRWDVDRRTDDIVTFTFVPADATGEGVGEEGQSQTFTWTELEGHAHFPTGTSRERATFTVADRQLDGWRYHVDGPDGPAVFDFADALPGPPVRSPGMTLIADSRL